MPFHVVPAVGPVLEQVLTDTFPLWGDGLPRENYAKAWAAQLKTPWGQNHLDRVALVDGPHVLSSAKRYDLSLRIDGRIRRVLGIGAVFTAAAHRGRGCARELLTRMLDTAVTEGQEFALLFSEIAPAFYEQLDFVPVPLIESTLEVDQKRGGAPAILVRSGDDKDVHAIAELSAARSTDARLAVDRSGDLIRFRSRRKRLNSGRAPSRRSAACRTVASSDFGSAMARESLDSSLSSAAFCARSDGSWVEKMASMRVICSAVRASSFWKRSVCHHLKLKPCASEVPGAAKTISDKLRQMNDLRSVFMVL